MTSISTALFENIPKHSNDIWINKYHYTYTGLTNKHWSDSFSGTILKLRIMKEETTLKLPSGQQVGNSFFFVNIDIAKHSYCTAWALFCPFPSGLLETNIWIQSGVSLTPFFWAKLCVCGQQLSLLLQPYLFPQPNLMAVMSIMFNYLHEKPSCTFVMLSGGRWRCRLTKTFNRKSQAEQVAVQGENTKTGTARRREPLRYADKQAKRESVSIRTNTLARTTEEYLECLSFCQGICVLSHWGLPRWR